MDFSLVEKARAAYARKKIILITVNTIIALAVITIILLVGGYSRTFFMFFVIVFVIPLSFKSINSSLLKKERVNYRRAYKEYFLVSNLQKLFTDVSYSRDLGINRAILAATDMIWTGDRFNSNDYITGKYRNVNFTYADVTIEESDSDSSGYYTTFKGQWMIFDFPKKFIHRIEIVQNDFYGGYKIARPKPNGRVFEEYTVESPTFQKKFRLLSDDSLDAFYVLDPDLIHRIELLSDNCEGSLLLCFVDNKLHVGLHNKKDSFEPPSPLKKINIQKENEKIINEFQNITNFVDYLKLGKNIFTNN